MSLSLDSDLSLSASGSAFSPSQLGPALWLDFSLNSSITPNSGNLQSIADISGNPAGIAFSQLTVPRQPPIAANGISGRQSVHGTAVSLQGVTSNKTMLQILGSATAAELIVVAQLNADGVADPFGISWSTADTGDYFEFSDGKTYSGVCGSARNTGNSVGTGVLTQPFVWGIQSAANLYSILINWSVNFTTATNTFTGGAVTPTLMNASGVSMAGFIGELLLFPFILATGDRANTRSYLTSRWLTP